MMERIESAVSRYCEAGVDCVGEGQKTDGGQRIPTPQSLRDRHEQRPSEANDQRWIEVCLPFRCRVLPEQEVATARCAIASRIREPLRSLKRARRQGEQLDPLFSSMEQIEGRLAQVAELLLWPGIRGQSLAERSLFLTGDGVRLEVSDRALRTGELLELEMHLPFYPHSYRVRATAIVERRAPERGPEWVEVRFDVIDEPGREALERYLFLLEKKIHAAREEREDTTLERVASWQVTERESSTSRSLPEPAVDEQWQVPLARSRSVESVPTTASRADALSRRLNAGHTPVDQNASVDELLIKVFEAMRALYSLESVDECLAFAVDLVNTSIQCEATVGLKTEPNGTSSGAAVVIAARGPRVTTARGRRFALRGSLVDVALTEGVSVSVSNAERDRRLCADVDCLLGAETRSYLCVPILYEGRSLGALMLLNRQLPGSWRQGELNVAAYIAGRVGEYIAESLPTRDVEHTAA